MEPQLAQDAEHEVAVYDPLKEPPLQVLTCETQEPPQPTELD